MTITLDGTMLWPILFVVTGIIAAHFALWPLQLHRYGAFAIGVGIVFSPVVWSLWQDGDTRHVAMIAICVTVGGITAIAAETWRVRLERKSGGTIRGMTE